MTAARIEIAEDFAHIFLRHDDLDPHDRLEEHGMGLAAGFFERQRSGNFEGHFRAIHVVIAAVGQNHGDIHHLVASDHAILHRLPHTPFYGSATFLGDRPSYDLVDEEQTML